MTFYVFEPEDRWSGGVLFIEASTDGEASEKANNKYPELNMKPIGTLEDIETITHDRKDRIYDKVYKE